jgi:pentatricopeptide repeat protein
MAPRWDKGICLAACLIGLLQSLPRLAYGFYTESLPPRYQHSPSKRPTEQPLRIRRRSSNALNDRINRFTAPGTAIGIAVEPTRDDAPKATYKRNSSRKGDRFAQTSLARNRKRTTLQKTPEQIETQLQCALQQLRIFSQSLPDRDAPIDMLLFPTVRECNAALAAFGDARELLRALRLFGKMRKATALQEHLRERINFAWPVPVPTLVTYSTLMSRAVKAQKPRVALRMWNLKGTDVVPDVKAANILMNCFAKLADVDKAQDLLSQMKSGEGRTVPRMTPNLVTYNTLLHACQKAGALDAALVAKAALDESGLIPDARTYTSLIATVARNPAQFYGQNDPSLAFAWLQEMTDRNVRPNGMTYSALIDVCGRCHRSDLALQGLRIMLRQKALEQKALPPSEVSSYSLHSEVGAWTAAINACGKSGRLETAIRLFYDAMPSFGCEPNTVTCGCLTDSLLRAGRTAETLDVLRFMKIQGIAPSEVMYTSLITHAERLVKIENKRMYSHKMEQAEQKLLDKSGDTKAIEVYTELMQFLIDGSTNRASTSKYSPESGSKDDNSNTLLLKVFLVFQEMKTAGAEPDVACYNALLRACARAGDFVRAQDVLAQMQATDLSPNDNSWRELLRAAAKIGRSDLAESIWRQALVYGNRRRYTDEPETKWMPTLKSFAALVASYMREAVDSSKAAQMRLFRRAVSLYEAALYGDDDLGMSRLDVNELLDSQRTMLLILQATVALEALIVSDGTDERRELRSTAVSILKLESFQRVQTHRLSWTALEAYDTARKWQV